MKRDPIEIDAYAVIEFVLDCLVSRLQEFKTPVAVGAFDGIHAHFLIQCLERPPRILVGIAKQYATAQLKAQMDSLTQAHGSAVGFLLDLKPGEGIWGKKSLPKAITDSTHYVNTFKYIRDHEKRGAVVIVPDLTHLMR